jgi:hypothetical protein
LNLKSQLIIFHSYNSNQLQNVEKSWMKLSKMAQKQKIDIHLDFLAILFFEQYYFHEIHQFDKTKTKKLESGNLGSQILLGLLYAPHTQNLKKTEFFEYLSCKVSKSHQSKFC